MVCLVGARTWVPYLALDCDQVVAAVTVACGKGALMGYSVGIQHRSKASIRRHRRCSSGNVVAWDSTLDPTVYITTLAVIDLTREDTDVQNSAIHNAEAKCIPRGRIR